MGCGQSTDGHVWAEPTQKVVHINSYNLEHNPYKNKSTFFKKTLSGLEIAAFFNHTASEKAAISNRESLVLILIVL